MEPKRLPAEGSPAEAWTSVVDVVADVGRAIEEAVCVGSIDGFGATILWLLYAQGWTQQDTARMLGVTERTISRQHHAALEALRDTGILQGYGADD